MLQWVREQSPPCPWEYNTCIVAEKGGHDIMEVLHWARSHGCSRTVATRGNRGSSYTVFSGSRCMPSAGCRASTFGSSISARYEDYNVIRKLVRRSATPYNMYCLF